jgi:hypothetical protein
MSSTPDVIKPAAEAEPPAANRFTPDAQERMARLRALLADFPDESDPKPLTRAEIRLARMTSPEALEKGAIFTEAVPAVGTTVVDVPEVREAIAFELAYSGFRDEMRAAERRVDHAILRKKLKAVKAIRTLYRMGKGYVTADAGDAVRPHLADLKRTLVPARRRKAAPPAQPEAATAARK